MRTITDKSLLDRKISDFSYELTNTNFREIETALKGLKTSSLVDALLVTGSLTTTILPDCWGVIPSAIAAIRGIQSYQEYKSKVQSNPSFFYWKIRQRESAFA